MPNIRAVRKAEWIGANIDGLKTLVEPFATNMQEALSRMQSENPDDADSRSDSDREPALAGLNAEETAGPFDLSLGQLTPLLFGTQAGSVLGYLGQNVLGQYDIGVPRVDSSELLFVIPNIAAFERDWSLPPMDLREWVALHEVAHRFEFSAPWVREHFVSLVDDFCSTMQLDVDGLRDRFDTIDMSNPESMQSMMQGEETLFGTVLDDEQRLKLNRIQSFMASAEGFADHVMHTLGRRLLTSYSQIDEAMRRYREGEQGDPVFERLLGIDVTREHYALGRAFCERVVDAADERLLAQMWDSAEALPSMPELEEPRLWLARTS
jgi:putative hydrolase